MATAEAFTMAAKAPYVAEILDQIAQIAPGASGGLNEIWAPWPAWKPASALPLPESQGSRG